MRLLWFRDLTSRRTSIVLSGRQLLGQEVPSLLILGQEKLDRCSQCKQVKGYFCGDQSSRSDTVGHDVS